MSNTFACGEHHLDLLDQLQAIHVGHVEVGDHKHDFTVLDVLQHIRGVDERDNFDLREQAVQQPMHDSRNVGLVVDDEDDRQFGAGRGVVLDRERPDILANASR